MSTRGRRIKPIGEILRFMDDLPITVFHDAHRIRWNAIVGEHKFGDPEISAACHSPDRKSLFIWLNEPAFLNVVPAAGPRARGRGGGRRGGAGGGGGDRGGGRSR